MSIAISTKKNHLSKKVLGWMQRAKCFNPKMKTVRISKGNMKLGYKIPNVNTSPPLTCSKMICLTTGCYAMKSYILFPSVRESQDHNTNLYFNYPNLFFENIISQLSRKRNPVKFFRWHSSGEIIDLPYFEGMKKVAKSFPNTRFLCFTKKYGISKYMGDCPKNLSIIFSAWKGIKIPKKIRQFNVAWVDDGSKSESKMIKTNSNKPFECGGDCDTCKSCWFTNDNKHDVIFHKH